MKNVLFRSRDGIFEILRTDICGVIRIDKEQPILKPQLIETRGIPKGTMVPSDKTEIIKRMRLLTTAGPVSLSSGHTEEMELFLAEYPYGVETFIADEKKLTPKPTAPTVDPVEG